MDKISPEIELLVSRPSSEDRPAPVPILTIQNSPPSCFSSPSLSYKLPSFLSSLVAKTPIVEVEEVDNINSDIEM